MIIGPRGRQLDKRPAKEGSQSFKTKSSLTQWRKKRQDKMPRECRVQKRRTVFKSSLSTMPEDERVCHSASRGTVEGYEHNQRWLKCCFARRAL